MTESPIQKEIMLALGSRPDIRMFRNNVGTAELKDGRWIKFGLHVGSSDLIGWRTITITPDMVGRRVAVFTGAEIKTKRGAIRPNQLLWQSTVRSFGGIAEILRSKHDSAFITDWKPSL